tara:strand:- start:481 stop:732 length:252 start_codon:yes stop_codon:yes gene_type:complete
MPWAQHTKTFQGNCGGCDYEYTAKSQKQAAMYKRLHEKKCSHSNTGQHKIQELATQETKKFAYNGGKVVDTTTEYTSPHGNLP